MSGLYEQPPPDPDHNNTPENDDANNAHWERWDKKRTFVRALEGTYSHLYESLINQPRVFSSSRLWQRIEEASMV